MFPYTRFLLILLAVTALAQNSPSPDSSGSDPVSIGIVLDNSAGRSETREAVKTVVAFLRDGDEYAIVAATDHAAITQELTDDPALASKALSKVHGHRRNVLLDGIVSGIDYLKEAAGNDRKALLVLSSGPDDRSRATVDRVLADAVQSGIAVYTVSVGARSWKANADLERLANATGGAAFFPGKSSEVDEVSAAIAGTLTTGRNKRSIADKPLAGYSELVVRSIPVSPQKETVAFPAGENQVLQKLMVSRLQAKRVFPRVVDGTTISGLDGRNVPHRAGEVELLGTIVSYREGSRLKRGTAGLLGSGVTRLRVQFIFRDAAAGKDLFALTEEGTGASGLLAGDNDDNRRQAMDRLIERLAHDIRKKTRPN